MCGILSYSEIDKSINRFDRCFLKSRERQLQQYCNQIKAKYGRLQGTKEWIEISYYASILDLARLYVVNAWQKRDLKFRSQFWKLYNADLVKTVKILFVFFYSNKSLFELFLP